MYKIVIRRIPRYCVVFELLLVGWWKGQIGEVGQGQHYHPVILHDIGIAGGCRRSGFDRCGLLVFQNVKGLSLGD